MSASASHVPAGLHRIYLAAATRVRSSPVVHRMLFGYSPVSEIQGQLWDWTTLALRRALDRHCKGGSSLLDMGTGPAGVLAIYARLRLGCGRICAVDHLEQLLPTAAACASRCGAEVEFGHSSLFSDVHGSFDVIAFNSPYIAAGDGRRLGVFRSRLDEERWSGGASGLDTIEKFLAESPGHLTAAGRVLLGVNRYYVPEASLTPIFARTGMRLVETLGSRLTMAAVFVLRD